MKLTSISLIILSTLLLYKPSTAQWQLSGNFPSWAVAHNNSSVFAGGTRGGSAGIFVTHDSGASWTFDSIFSGNSQVTKLIVKDSLIFALMGNDYIYKSPDGGQSWSLVTAPFISPYVMTLADSVLLVGTLTTFTGRQGTIYRSVDYGNTWDSTLTPASEGIISLASRGPEAWAACVAAAPNIYYSHDAGSTWTLKNNSFYPQDFSLGIAGSNVLCGSSSGLFLSADTGIGWSKVNPFSFLSFAAAPNYTFAGASGFYTSPDYGYTWLSNSAGLPDSGNIVGITVADSVVFVCNYYAVYKRNLSELLTGINSPLAQINCSPFPNPFANELILNHTVNSGKVELLNLLGEVILRQPASASRTLLNTDNLPPGIYLLRYIEKDNCVDFKVIKSDGR